MTSTLPEHRDTTPPHSRPSSACAARRWLIRLPSPANGSLASLGCVPDTHGVIDNDPGVPGLPRVSHPADSSTLPLYMVFFFLLGLGGFAVYGVADGGKALVLAIIVSVVFFTCFLILFTIYWLGYLLKGHASWQAEQRARSAGPSTDE
ncbi:hypothetical protein [Micromonospora orduensis]|uniref:hypothetical protein n=1 Tax=Micromonospora orduensis TaxID=1420891 RepID=UPI00363FC4CC